MRDIVHRRNKPRSWLPAQICSIPVHMFEKKWEAPSKSCHVSPCATYRNIDYWFQCILWSISSVEAALLSNISSICDLFWHNKKTFPLERILLLVSMCVCASDHVFWTSMSVHCRVEVRNASGIRWLWPLAIIWPYPKLHLAVTLQQTQAIQNYWGEESLVKKVEMQIFYDILSQTWTLLAECQNYCLFLTGNMGKSQPHWWAWYL